METELKNQEVEERNKKNLTFGVALIAIGVVYLLERMDIATFFIHQYLFRWESLVILLALLLIFIQRKYFAGLVLLATGGYFILDELYFIPRDWNSWFLPLLLIIGGLFFLIKPEHKK